MSYVEYEKAQKLGLKAFKAAVAKGENEYLPVLDEILEGVEIQSEVNLGLVQIPIDQIVGTSNVGRTYSFANNFMPILNYRTEFGAKWGELYDSQIEEGIREPIKVFEYLNKFYVVEGNKRVSVMKFLGAVTIPGVVTRKIPKLTDDPEIRIYYEFLEFYKLTEINYLHFSEEGCYKRLLELTCEDVTAVWDEDQRKDFGSAHHNFCTALKSRGGEKLPIESGDAFLIFIDIYGYENIKDLTGNEMKGKVDLLWDEFKDESKGQEIELRMEPSKKGRKRLMEYFKAPAPKVVDVAFIFDKDPKESEWLYGHELGRLYLEETYPDRFQTMRVIDVKTEEETIDAIENLIEEGIQIIFTTSSRQAAASVKAAVNHPNVVVMNCSLNTSYKLIRTYYARLYEVKFLAGMIAGSLSPNGKIGYLADYPIYGMTANINAFALGARMVNPKAKVYLKWTTVKGVSRERVIEEFKANEIYYVSDQTMIKPNAANRQFGLYCIEGEEPVNLAMPIYQWGVFYEKLIDAVLNGSFQQEGENEDKAINYWWGLSAKVVDIIYSKKLPVETQRLVQVFKKLLMKNEFQPFEGELYNQEGTIVNEPDEAMLPEEIMKMDWLLDNVKGEIPEIEALRDEAKSIVELKGVSENI
ncbi:MAG: BMP family ABC transporter substrate-binding protein [Eubacteriales bacterium]|nr:BMP family ABC transporter substrate-binding protein [Eubacteriales bacterium]